MDIVQNRTMHDMAMRAFQDMNILIRYMNAINYPRSYELDESMEWLSNTIYKLNEESVIMTD